MLSKHRIYPFILLLALSACSSGDENTAAPLRIQVFTGAYSSIPVHVADELGLFQKYGLSIEKLPANSSSAALAAMIGGSIDIVESAADLVMANIDKGTKLKYLMSNEGTNYVSVVAGSHVQLDSEDIEYPNIISNFKGLRIGVNAIGSSLHLTGLLMLEEAGLTSDDVEFVATGSAATTMSAWRAGAVDIQITFSPVPELLDTLDAGRTLFVLADEGPSALRFQGLYGGWVTTNKFLESDSDKADAFIKAMRESIDWIRNPDNETKMLEIATQHAPVSGLTEGQNRSVLANMIEHYRRFWGYEISNDAIEMWNDYALRFDLIKNRIAFEDIVYTGAPVCAATPCQ